MIDDRPLPDTQAEHDATFWEAAAEGRLLVQECGSCGHRQLYPGPVCRACHAEAPGWIDAEGTGEVHSYTVIRRATEHRAFEPAIPYVVASVELPEGPRMLTNVVGCDVEDVEVGMPVVVEFEPLGEGVAIPVFRPR